MTEKPQHHHPLVINVDMDGVLADNAWALRTKLEAHGYRYHDQWEQEYSLKKRLVPGQLSNRAHDRLYDHFTQRGMYRNAPALPLTKLVERWVSRGHRVRVVTARLQHSAKSRAGRVTCAEDTAAWLAHHHLMPGVDLVFSTHGDKQDYSADLVLDDQPNYERWAQQTVGTLNLMVARPYNNVDLPQWVSRKADEEIMEELWDL